MGNRYTLRVGNRQIFYPLLNRYARICDLDIPREKWLKLFANNEDPDQTPHFAASDLGLHYLPSVILGGFQIKIG